MGAVQVHAYTVYIFVCICKIVLYLGGDQVTGSGLKLKAENAVFSIELLVVTLF